MVPLINCSPIRPLHLISISSPSHLHLISISSPSHLHLIDVTVYVTSGDLESDVLGVSTARLATMAVDEAANNNQADLEHIPHTAERSPVRKESAEG
jgi:hypothetical protein